MNLSEVQQFEMPTEKRGAGFFSGLVCWFGTIVTIIFMVSTIAHAYVTLKLLPNLPFLSTEQAGIALAVGLCCFNYCTFSKLVGRWSWKKVFLVICVSIVIGLELILSTASIVKQNSGDDYIKASGQKIDSLVAMANQVDQEMSNAFTDRLAALETEIKRSETGDDVTRQARCGSICKTYIQHRDSLATAFIPLAKTHPHAAVPEPANLTQKFAVLLSALLDLSAKHEMFRAFAATATQQEQEIHDKVVDYVSDVRSATPAEMPAGVEFDELVAEVHQIQNEVFGGRDGVTEQALLLSMTAQTLRRCVTLNGSPMDYIAVLVGLALVCLVPAWSVARIVNRESLDTLTHEIKRAESAASLWDRLRKARQVLGVAKLKAAVAEFAWRGQVVGSS